MPCPRPVTSTGDTDGAEECCLAIFGDARHGSITIRARCTPGWQGGLGRESRFVCLLVPALFAHAAPAGFAYCARARQNCIPLAGNGSDMTWGSFVSVTDSTAGQLVVETDPAA